MREDISKYIRPGTVRVTERTVVYRDVIAQPPELNFSETAPYAAKIEVPLGTEKVELRSNKNGKITQSVVQYSKNETSMGDVLRLLTRVLKDKFYKKNDEVKIEYSGLDPKTVELADTLKTQYAGLMETWKNQVKAVPVKENTTTTTKEFQVTPNGIVPVSNETIDNRL
jgi:hypothetical protein